MAYRIFPRNSLVDSVHRGKNEAFIVVVNAFLVLYLGARLPSHFVFGNNYFNFDFISIFKF